MATESKRKANARYDEKATTQFKMKLNYKTDEDILQRLAEVDNKQGYVKDLIRQDLKKGKRVE